MCKEEGCTKRPYYNYNYGDKPEFCGTHRKPNHFIIVTIFVKTQSFFTNIILNKALITNKEIGRFH